jgi:hypothetical protein
MHTEPSARPQQLTASKTLHRASMFFGLLLVAAVTLVASVSSASAAKHHGHHGHHHKPKKAAAYAPPKGKVFHGVSDTGDVGDFGKFSRQTGSHPAVLQDFYHWGTPLTTGALERWHKTKTRGVLSLSTAPGDGTEVISPKQIAIGRDDHYILRLGESIKAARQVVYIRLLPEMNGSWNPYSAYNADGTARDSAHSTKWFKQAWRRFDLIVKGGKRKVVNQKLRKLHMPRILRAKSENDKVYKREGVLSTLPQPKVALQWVPQTSGSPNKKGNRPQAYWPGSKYVDWVGADVYSKYSNHTLWSNLNKLYKAYPKVPFLIGEYSAWDNDKSGSFVNRLFDWARKNNRTRMLIYYRSVDPDNVFNLQFYPGAKDVLHSNLNGPRFAPKAPEFVKRHR